MALKRSLAWLVVAVGLIWLVGCGNRPAGGLDRPSQVALVEGPRRSGADTLVVFMPDSAHTRQAWETMKDELQTTFNLTTRVVTSETQERDLERDINAAQPKAVVLMGNLPMNLYLKYQAKHPAERIPPAVVVMASFFDEQRPLFRNATGIAYEIPGISTFVSLRSFVYARIQRVGVVYRPLFASYLEKQGRLAHVEQVELVPMEVSSDPGPYEIRSALDQLMNKEKVDAIWVLNDNTLLEPELVAKGWLYMLHRNPKLVVVGVSSLVDTRLHFGSFAMLPDHAGLGVQTANLIFKLAEEGWDASAQPTELPISVQTVVDLPWTSQHFQVREDALERIDRIVR
jgi:hypothetical protein